MPSMALLTVFNLPNSPNSFMASSSSTLQVTNFVRRTHPKLTHHHNINPLRFSYQLQLLQQHPNFSFSNFGCTTTTTTNKSSSITILCFASNKPDISSTAKIRSEVLTPFRSVRMFFYLAFIASAGLGGLIALSQVIGALSNPARAAQVPEIVKGLGIDLGAVSIFAFLYSRENKAKNLQIARLSREENLSNLKVRVDEKKIIPVSSLRGIARLVILSGPGSYIAESFSRSKPFAEQLLERGVLVVSFATDGQLPTFEFDESQDVEETVVKRRRLWQLVPFDISEWSRWLNEQKELANVTSESPVYISLRLDGRVRGSGVGYPPWNAFVAQLPPAKGIWSGLLDGMDGRV